MIDSTVRYDVRGSTMPYSSAPVSYGAPVTYAAPTTTYAAPATTTYGAPTTITNVAPATTTYAAPTTYALGTTYPTTMSYAAPAAPTSYITTAPTSYALSPPANILPGILPPASILPTTSPAPMSPMESDAPTKGYTKDIVPKSMAYDKHYEAPQAAANSLVIEQNIERVDEQLDQIQNMGETGMDIQIQELVDNQKRIKKSLWKIKTQVNDNFKELEDLRAIATGHARFLNPGEPMSPMASVASSVGSNKSGRSVRNPLVNAGNQSKIGAPGTIPACFGEPKDRSKDSRKKRFFNLC